MGVEVMEFGRQNVRLWDEVKGLSPEALLHLHIVVAQAVLAGDFVTHWEVVDSLELIQAFVEVALAGAGGPEEVPLVRLSVTKAVHFEHRSYQLGFTLEYFVEHLLVVDVVGTAVGLTHSHIDQLRLLNWLDLLHLICGALGGIVDVLSRIKLAVLLFNLDGFSVEKVGARLCGTVVTYSYHQREIVFNVTQSVENPHKSVRP